MAKVFEYAATFRKIAFYNEQYDAELESPNIVIQPYEEIIDAAVKKIKALEGNYFKGIRRIEVAPSSDYGHVKSGPNEDPTVVFINSSRVKQELANTEEDEMVNVVAGILAHEVGHVRSYDPQKGFVGGETPAEAEEQRVLQLLRS